MFRARFEYCNDWLAEDAARKAGHHEIADLLKKETSHKSSYRPQN